MEGAPKYYSTDGSGDYKAFLEHFKRQAEGSDRLSLLNRQCSKVRSQRRGRLILVNTKKSQGVTSHGDTTDKLEVVDPNEAERRRALSEVVREEAEVTKEVERVKNAHSAKGARKRRLDVNKSARAAAKTKIKRVRDIFDD